MICTGTVVLPMQLLSKEEAPGPRCAFLYQKICMPRQYWLLDKLDVHPDERSNDVRIIHIT